ncbi:MAG: hypothetical protein ACKPKO_62785, partial [Candidatus Fonsibacter sp.]
VRATDIEFSDVASSGATLLSIKSGTTTFMSMALTVGIKHFTYSDFNNNHVYIVKGNKRNRTFTRFWYICGTKMIIHLFTSFGFLLSATSNTTFSMHLFRSG